MCGDGIVEGNTRDFTRDALLGNILFFTIRKHFGIYIHIEVVHKLLLLY